MVLAELPANSDFRNDKKYREGGPLFTTPKRFSGNFLAVSFFIQRQRNVALVLSFGMIDASTGPPLGFKRRPPDACNEENAKDDDDDDDEKKNNNVGVAGYYAAALEEKYARRLSVGCRRRTTHFAANVWSCTTPREKRREEEEEEEEDDDDDDDALFSVPVKVEREEEEEEDEDEKEDGINKEMMVFRSSTPPLNAKRRREKIREANARLDEDVRRVRDVMEELMKAGDAASEYRYREEDEEENGRRRGGEEEEEEERVPARDDETSEELLRLRKGLGIASSSSSTLTRKGASYWSVPAEDLVRQLVGEDDAKKMRGGLSAEEEPDDAGIDQTPRRIDAESLRSAGIL